MKTAGKLASGWLLTMGFMFMTLSISSVFDKNAMQKESPQVRVDVDEIEFTPQNVASGTDYNPISYFIFGVPTLTLGGWLALGLYRDSKQEKKVLNQQTSDRLQSVFYNMLTEYNGRITVLGFAMQSQLPAATARQYLDEKAEEFHANFKISNDGAISYHFDV